MIINYSQHPGSSERIATGEERRAYSRLAQILVSSLPGIESIRRAESLTSVRLPGSMIFRGTEKSR